MRIISEDPRNRKEFLYFYIYIYLFFLSFCIISRFEIISNGNQLQFLFKVKNLEVDILYYYPERIIRTDSKNIIFFFRRMGRFGLILHGFVLIFCVKKWTSLLYHELKLFALTDHVRLFVTLKNCDIEENFNITRNASLFDQGFYYIIFW